MYTILCNVSDILIHRTVQASEVRNFLTREGRNPKAFAIYEQEPELCNGIRGDAWLRLHKHGADLEQIKRRANSLAEEIFKWTQANQDAEYILRRELDYVQIGLRDIAACADEKARAWRQPQQDPEDIPF